MQYYEAIVILHGQIEQWRGDMRSCTLRGDHAGARKHAFLIEQLQVAGAVLSKNGSPENRLFGLQAESAPRCDSSKGAATDPRKDAEAGFHATCSVCRACLCPKNRQPIKQQRH